MIATGRRRQAFYTDSPPGKYTFHVIAANSDSVWNGNPATLDFSVGHGLTREFEIDVLRLIGAGNANKQIAVKLSIIGLEARHR